HIPFYTLFPYTTLFRSIYDKMFYLLCQGYIPTSTQNLQHAWLKLPLSNGGRFRKPAIACPGCVTPNPGRWVAPAYLSMSGYQYIDRKSTRLNSSHVSIS